MMPQKVYKYRIEGYAESFVDPVAIRRALLRETDGQFWEYVGFAYDLEKALIEHQHTPVPDSPEELLVYQARGRHISVQLAEKEDAILDAAYAVFGWPKTDPHTGQGVPQVEALRIIKEFLEYAEKKE